MQMNITRIAKYVSAGLLGLGMIALPQARADQWDEKVVFTFNAPVEVPGQVLPPGTYVFRLADLSADREVVEVFNKEENHLFGYFLAIPDYHLKTPDKPIITFEERAAGAPEAIKAWFYPGDRYGHDFVYPKVKAMALATANNQPVASMPNELAANTTQSTSDTNKPDTTALNRAPLTAQQPNRQEVGIAEVFTPPPASAQAPAPAPAAAPAAPAAPSELPRTAGNMPLIGLLGLISLGAAGSLRYASAKIK
jgi:hypothetical protein